MAISKAAAGACLMMGKTATPDLILVSRWRPLAGMSVHIKKVPIAQE